MAIMAYNKKFTNEYKIDIETIGETIGTIGELLEVARQVIEELANEEADRDGGNNPDNPDPPDPIVPAPIVPAPRIPDDREVEGPHKRPKK